MANSLFVDGIHLIVNLIREACLANWILQPKSNQTRNIYEMVSVPYIALQCKSCQPIVDVYSFVIRFLLQSLTVSETGQFNQTLSFVHRLWALTIGMCSVQSHILLELWCPCTWSTEMKWHIVWCVFNLKRVGISLSLSFSLSWDVMGHLSILHVIIWKYLYLIGLCTGEYN